MLLTISKTTLSDGKPIVVFANWRMGILVEAAIHRQKVLKDGHGKFAESSTMYGGDVPSHV
jgi:hypothetical protein